MSRLIAACRLVCTVMLLSPCAQAQIHHVAEMNAKQIEALDRAHTVVLLPAGILEEHGPYMPSFADGYQNEWAARRLAEAIVGRPGWHVLMFPTLPLGTGGANEIGGKYVFPGTYGVRTETLRAVFMDWATELGEQGFRWIFVIHSHGGPNHNRALDQAGDYFRDTYGGHMVHLYGIAWEIPEGDESLLTKDEQREDGLDVHAGAIETSSLLFVRPDLVAPGFAQARPQAGASWEELMRLAKLPDWPGYVGSPRLASAAKGMLVQEFGLKATIANAFKVLDGFDERKFVRYGDVTAKIPGTVAISEAEDRQEAALRQRQADWLAAHGLH